MTKRYTRQAMMTWDLKRGDWKGLDVGPGPTATNRFGTGGGDEPLLNRLSTYLGEGGSEAILG